MTQEEQFETWIQGYTWWYAPIPSTATETPNARKQLADRSIQWFDITRADRSPGRRLRAFAAMIKPNGSDPKGIATTIDERLVTWGMDDPVPFKPAPIMLTTRKRVLTYREAYNVLHHNQSEAVGKFRHIFSSLRLRRGDDERDVVTEIPTGAATYRDPDLPGALQDLGYEIIEDIRDAGPALHDPNHFYPGVDEGIEPVSDDHVRLVMWAMQRELNRELRPGMFNGWSVPLPAFPLEELPWRVQRALAERRRLRYQEFGIGRKQWEENRWSLFDIPEDPDWTPRRHIRMMENRP